MIELYGVPLSGPANKARYTACAVDIEYEFKIVNLMEGEQGSEKFLAINPVGKVPALRDGDFCLFESNAIARYLAAKAHSDLLPSELQVRALVDQWMEYVSHHIMNAVGKIVFNTHFYKMMNAERDERSLAEGKEWLNKYLKVVDQHLQNKEFFLGDSMTLADIAFISAVDPIDVIEFDIQAYPEACRLRDKLRQQAFYTACHSSFGETFKSIVSAV